MASTKWGALKKAADVIKAAAMVSAGSMAHSSRIPGVMNVQLNYTGGFANIRAGFSGGEWGWTPIHAWMFEEPHGARIPKHPYFGDREHWYYQPYRPYMETAAESSAGDAAQVYADEMYAYFCKQYGYH